MTNMWMVRAGEEGFLINDFKELNIVAIGWELDDLSSMSSDEIKQLMKEEYPEYNNRKLSANYKQVSQFVYDFNTGDYVLSYDQKNREYIIGIITSDYHVSDKLSIKYNKEQFYQHVRDVKWIGVANRDELNETTIKSLNYPKTIANINDDNKNHILNSINQGKIEWPDFYMELADKLLEYKENRTELINKIQNIFSNLNLKLPTLENNICGNPIAPFDIDPFTVFALFNKQITYEKRFNFIKEFKKEFSIESKIPYSFHGIAVVNNLSAAFYRFKSLRGENDIQNLWDLFEIALDYPNCGPDKFIDVYNEVSKQSGIKWNITMGLNWIRPFTFMNLDKNSRDILSTDDIFQEEFRDEIKSLKSPITGEEYLKICETCANAIDSSNKYKNFPDLSHSAYMFKIKNQNDEDGMGDNDVKTTKYWLISAGEGSKLWDEFYNEGIIGIKMRGIGDFGNYTDKNEIKIKFQEIFNDESTHKNDVHCCWQFAHDLQIGDVIFVKKGRTKIIGRGIIESDYYYDENKEYPHIRKVNWTHKGNWDYTIERLAMKTLTDLTNYTETVNNIKEFFIDENDDIDDNVPEIKYPEYTQEDFLEEVYVTNNDYETLSNLLENKKNLIIEGAPGVGKTFMAKRLAYSIMGEKNIDQVMMVQFHQSYSYEDFIMGYRPFENGFKLREGSFYKFCKKAADDLDNDYFFIIDEINRGNISKIFGELFMLIEADKRGEKNRIPLLYSDEYFYIPKNVHIIGLMNTADRSLAMIDYALRRRFSFFDLKPGFESDGFASYKEELDSDEFNQLIDILCELNQEISNDESLGEGFRIGHSYLCNFDAEDIGNKLKYVVEYELIPLLKEYWFDEQEKIEYWSSKLRSVINDI